MTALEHWLSFTQLQQKILQLLQQNPPDLTAIQAQATLLDSTLRTLPQKPPADCPADTINALQPLIEQANQQNQVISKKLHELRIRELKENTVDNSRDQRLKQTLHAYSKPTPANPRFIDRHR